MAETKNWRLQGSYFETCNCETACPCVWFKPPTHGDCRLLVAWHIEKGHFHEHALDGLNVALACYSPGDMKEGKWQAALYVDEAADIAQFSAISRIFSGQVGGHLAVLMTFVGEVLGVKKVKIDYREVENVRELVIPDIAHAEIESIQGITDGLSSIDNPPLCVVSSHPSIVARSKRYRYMDYDFDWSFSERNGFYSPFLYQP
ncbi:MAG: DUF1326 domain-containing protein [Gammaproteobacteria bacterium]